MNDASRSRFVRAIDALVNAVAPVRGLQREIARQKLKAFSYEGANASRHRGRAINQTNASPENPNYQRERVQLAREARDLSENGELCAGILKQFEDYVAGSIRYQASTGDEKVNNEYEEYFDDWCLACDFSGRHSFRKLLQLDVRHTVMDGDVGCIIRRVDDRLFLSGIESDRIGDPNRQTNEKNYVAGIVLDDLGRPTNYRIYDRDINGGSYSNPVDIQAASFIHIMNPRRHDEYRGISAFHAVINNVRDTKEIVEFEKSAVKWASAQAGVVTGSKPGPASNAYFEEGTEAGTNAPKRLETIEQGRVNYIEENGTFTQFRIDRPGAAWQGFLQLLIKLYSAGLGLSYGFVFEMAGLTGPAARFESMRAKRTFEGWQELFREKKLDRIKNLVIANGIAHDGLTPHPRWMRGTWQWPAHPTIDVGRESAANLNENRQGLKSMDTICAEENIDARAEREKIAEECAHWLELSKKHNVPVQMMRRTISGGFETFNSPVDSLPPKPADPGDQEIPEEAPAAPHLNGARASRPLTAD